MADRRERAFDRVRGAQVLPVLGGEVVEGEQRIAVLHQARDRLVVLDPVGLDEARPFQAVPHPGGSWRPRGQPATQPHEYIRGGTTKILTLFHPATGQVRLQSAARGTNAVLPPWLREHLSAILAELPPPAPSQDPAATPAAWAVWQAGLTRPFTLPHDLPPLRLLLVWDNLTGHKTPDLVLWL